MMITAKINLHYLDVGDRFRLVDSTFGIFEIFRTGGDREGFAVLEGDPDRREYSFSELAKLNACSYFVATVFNLGDSTS